MRSVSGHLFCVSLSSISIIFHHTYTYMDHQTNIHPMSFEPILKSVIWGGEKIAPFKGIVTEQTRIGESWEVSGVPGHESVVAEGPDKGKTLGELVRIYKGALVGEKVYARFGDTFPLLIKIIDAAGDLSLQVHPDDELAQARHNSLGKTEMWHIIDTDPGAVICAGLSEPITPDEYVAKVADNTLMDVIAHHDSHPGDTFFLPAGRVHSIGAGNMLVEVQETSDVTYRIYDFGRLDANGQPRELHVEQAKDAIDYTVYPDYRTEPQKLTEGITMLVECDHFSVVRLHIEESKKIFFNDLDSFFTSTCIEGEFEITDDRNNTITLHRGQTILIPAMAKTLVYKGTGVVINAYMDSVPK